MRIALAQTNPVVGDIPGNTRRAAEFIRKAAQAGADLVAFSELSMVGYPPRDLLGKGHFVADCQRAVEQLARECTEVAALVGTVRPTPESSGRPLQNCAALLAGGEVRRVHAKSLLPTYDVFDETRYFQPGRDPGCVEVAGRRIGISICEDLWDEAALGRGLYAADPVAELSEQGAEIIVNLAASPYHVGKAPMRETLFGRQARRSQATIVYVNQVGGNDELIFDGASSVIRPDGQVVGRAGSFVEDLLMVDINGETGRCEPLADPIARLSQALKLGLRDYVSKCGFEQVVLGLSGGIDSAVVAVLAADALGPGNVQAIAMPSRYSSDHSLDDARTLAENVGIEYQVVPIEPAHAAFEASLAGVLEGPGRDVAAENIQARIRGVIVMAASNAKGPLPLATGNKSELSVGYCTLYGDMCGGLAPIGDVLKTVAYQLAEQLNREAGFDRIPRSILDKPPSAELKPDQTDQDKLPAYELLDEILSKYIVEDWNVEQIVESGGLDEATVRRVVRMVDAAEYKRKQAAPVLKVSPRAFGTGRRMPIAQRYREPGS